MASSFTQLEQHAYVREGCETILRVRSHRMFIYTCSRCILQFFRQNSMRRYVFNLACWDALNLHITITHTCINIYKPSLMKTSKQKIQELFALKPSRAVDVIFSENKIDQVHELYATLQQSKKMNTIALKQTLQNNYEKMLYCSQLLDQVKKYSQAVKEVASVIQTHTDGIQGKQSTHANRDQTSIAKIEGLIRKHRFSEAMAESFKQQQSLTSSERYFLNYLRIQIITKMERHICLNKIDKFLVQEYARCLESLLFDTSRSWQGMRKKTEEFIKDFDEKSLLYLANKRIERLKKVQNRQQMEALIYEILFEYKLGKIKNKFKTEHNSDYFEQYFEELATIIKVYKSMRVEGGEARNLSAVFSQCTAQIKSQLSSIFIFRQQSDQIVFKCELYEQLINSPRFEAIMNNFYTQISQENGQGQNPLTFIKELWHNYFINLVDLQLEQAHPLVRVSSLKHHGMYNDNIPDELKIYLHDHSLEQSLHFITEYQDKLKVLIKNLVPIIQKCTPSELISFAQKFNSKAQQICLKCEQFTARLEAEKAYLDESACSYANKLNNQNEQIVQFKIRRKANDLTCVTKKTLVLLARTKDFINDAIIDFDRFFIGYLEGVQAHLKEIIVSVLSQFSIIILMHIHDQTTGRLKDILSHTIQSLKVKKEKVTILDTIAVPYLAKNIFQCDMKPVCLEQQFYYEHFVCRTPIKPVEKPAEMSVDDFEIGQKQQKQELVKVKIGKSIMNLGNNLITGFMKKKDLAKQ